MWVPGRIEVFGKHTDYAGGESLTCASEQGIAALVERHEKASLIIHDVARGLEAEFAYNKLVQDGSWTIYPFTVLKRVISDFGMPEHGIRLVISSDLPSASGMSSSSCLVVAVLLGLLSEGGYSDLPFSDVAAFAGYAGAVESGAPFLTSSADAESRSGVGTRGGSQDHTAILLSESETLGLYGYHPVQRFEQIVFPDDCTFVIGGSGVKANKTGSAREAYNRASDMAAEVARLYSVDVDEHFPTMGAMMASPYFDRESLRWAIPDNDLWDRYQQFEREVDYVIPEAIRAIKASDWDTFGHVADNSQRMASDWLLNQIPETNALVRLARGLGAYGANGFGAGFGGAVWALVKKESALQFKSDWATAYRSAYPQHGDQSIFLLNSPGPGAWVSLPGSVAGVVSGQMN